MNKKTMAATAMALAVSLGAMAQGNNHGMGGNDDGVESIAARVAKIEKKHDVFNLYINYSASAQAEYNSLDKEWDTRFANKQLRLEIKGNLTDRLFYRMRHRLNKSTDAKGNDNFAKATDIMMVGYKFNDKLTVQAGKMIQIWGGYEFDENPLYIYQFSDFGDHIDPFQAGVVLSYKPVPSQELAVEVSNTHNGSFKDEYGETPWSIDKASETKTDHMTKLEKAKCPLTYIVNWNGSFLNGLITTRWAYGFGVLTRNKYSRKLTLGQKLTLPRIQWYVDYMGAFDDIDRLGMANSDLHQALDKYYVYDYLYGNNPLEYYFYYEQYHFGKVHYNSLITKINWQFAPRFNLMLKGCYETASVTRDEPYRNYRKSYSCIGSIEYYPVKQQDLRVFAAYTRHNYDFSKKCALADYNTSRIELGFMYRIKAY